MPDEFDPSQWSDDDLITKTEVWADGIAYAEGSRHRPVLHLRELVQRYKAAITMEPGQRESAAKAFGVAEGPTEKGA